MLRSAGVNGVTNERLSRIALRYGGYLGSLYKKGYKINKELLGNNIYNYVLVSEPDADFTSKVSAKDILLENVESHGICSKQRFEDLLNSLGLSVRYKSGTHL